MNPLIDAPIGDVLTSRYNDDAPPRGANTHEDLNKGGIPLQIPRIWAIGLRALQGRDSWGFPSTFHKLRLPHQAIIAFGRVSAESISAINLHHHASDTTYIPAIFVGWNPTNARE